MAQGNTRTRGPSYPRHKKQRALTALLDLILTKLREGHDFTALTFKVLAPELENIARTLAGDNEEEINLIAANHPFAFSNMVTVLFQNEFRKGATKERPGARTKGSSAAPSRGFARLLSNFHPSDDPAADMVQFRRHCVDAGLGEDNLKAVRLMRSTAPLGTVNVEETAGRPLFGGTQPGADNEFSFGESCHKKTTRKTATSKEKSGGTGRKRNVFPQAATLKKGDGTASARMPKMLRPASEAHPPDNVDNVDHLFNDPWGAY